MTVLSMSILLGVGGNNEVGHEWTADLNNNGIVEYYSLNKHQIKISEDRKIIWQSPKTWQVEQIVVGDVTNDGQQELVFLLWKEGSYGASKPFWMKTEDTAWSNHLYVYSLVGDHIKPVWCSSALRKPLRDLQIVSDPQDGKNYLTGREYKWKLTIGTQNDLLLKWNDWGFTVGQGKSGDDSVCLYKIQI